MYAYIFWVFFGFFGFQQAVTLYWIYGMFPLYGKMKPNQDGNNRACNQTHHMCTIIIRFCRNKQDLIGQTDLQPLYPLSYLGYPL